jgi:mRNA-degrading endonuclease YafQ of YafQ-DinJ toxin-antitoxin module
MLIYYSPEFTRRFKKLRRELKLKALEKEIIFKKNYLDPRLKTHKLSGNLAGRLAFWIDFKNRIVFSFVDSTTVYFHSIGTHDIYK